MRRRGPEKYLGKREYEKHLRHLTESSTKAKIYVEQSDEYLLPEYSCHASDETYLTKYKNGEVVQLLAEEFSAFQSKQLKKHWFLTENFVLGSNFQRFERFCMKKLGKPTGWDSEKLLDQCSFLQYVRFYDRTNCLEMFKFDLPEALIRPSDIFDFTRTYAIHLKLIDGNGKKTLRMICSLKTP